MIMNKKITFKIFIISFISVLSMDKLISSEDSEDKVPLLYHESSNGLRHRRQPQAEDSSIDLKKTSVQEQEIESRDDIFSSLGRGWDLFKQGNYEKAYNHIYLASKAKRYAARYLLARFYEFGLVGEKDSILASKLYASVLEESNNNFLKSISDEGLVRIIELNKRKLCIISTVDFLKKHQHLFVKTLQDLWLYNFNEEKAKEIVGWIDAHEEDLKDSLKYIKLAGCSKEAASVLIDKKREWQKRLPSLRDISEEKK